ncbi:MAG: heavy metal-binding domain-containing protein [Nitrosopumilaceae archaeon]
MIISTIAYIPHKEISESLGLVMGNTVRARYIGSDIWAGVKNLIGGEIKGYTTLMSQARQEAIDRMVEEAKKVGADAIVNVRFVTSEIVQGAAEMLAYGTAVKLTNK